MEKILTIAIPAYNMEKYLAQTLDSMIVDKETMDALEVIIVDDGSKDNTAAIAKRYVDDYPDTFKLVCKENGGHGSALNKGLELATGKYYRPIDADDWVDSQSLVYIVNDLRKHNVDMVLANFCKVLEKSGKVIKVRCNNVYNFREIMDGKAVTRDGREICVYDSVYDFNNELYDYAPQYLYHFVMYRTALLKKHGIRFSEKVFYDDMEYDIYPLPYVKTVLPIDRYFYMYRLEREGQSVEDAGFIRHRKHRYTIVLNLCRYFKEMKDRFGKNVYNHLYPDMVWKADRQYDIYFLSEDDEIAAQEMADFDRALKETNEEIYNDIKNEAVLKYRRGASYAQAKKIFLATKERVESRGKRPKAWTLESDPEMHEMIARRVRLKKFHLDKRDKEMQKIAALKDSEKGKRCFITCTGPSLKIEDLELLKDEITIGVNSVVKAYDKTDWRPTYYAMVDYYAFGEFLKNTDLPGKKLCEKNAFLHYRVDPKNKTGKEIYCLINYANHFENRLTAKDILFSDDLSVCAYDAFTVTNFAIQVAMYLGFKEIYIIGADCNYSGSQIHFIEMPDDHVKMAAGWLPDALALSIEGYKAIKKYAEERGVKIFNSTRGGMLEVFPRKSIEEVLKNRG